MTLFYILNATQYINLITTSLTINKQQLKNVLRGKVVVNSEYVFHILKWIQDLDQINL